MFLLICPSERNINCLLSRASPPLPLPPRRSRDRNRLRGARSRGSRLAFAGAGAAQGPPLSQVTGWGGVARGFPAGARKEATSQPRTRVLSPPRGHLFLHPRDPRVVRLSSKALERGAWVRGAPNADGGLPACWWRGAPACPRTAVRVTLPVSSSWLHPQSSPKLKNFP